MSQWLWVAEEWQCSSNDPVPEITVSRTLSHRREFNGLLMHVNVFILLTYLTELIHPIGEVPSHLLTKKNFAVLSKLYAYKGDFPSIICSDHLFVKHSLMKTQGSNTLPKIGLAGLAAKKIPPMALKKPLLHHPCLPSVCNSAFSAGETRPSSKRSSRDEDDLEAGGSKTHEVVEPHASKGLNYDQSFHMKKILEMRPSDVNSMVFDMMPPNLQWAITTVDSF
ncbi:hypothetical protein Fot_06927 [Forsythia ovata]|uniref:Uncharacterized protein n=1 Tax=Forsythia ovata TaxID=205694 RepID=A0ABD1WX92_9LAMI